MIDNKLTQMHDFVDKFKDLATINNIADQIDIHVREYGKYVKYDFPYVIELYAPDKCEDNIRQLIKDTYAQLNIAYDSLPMTVVFSNL